MIRNKLPELKGSDGGGGGGGGGGRVKKVN